LTVQYDRATTQNAVGELVPSWTAVVSNPTIFASIEQKNGREFFSAQQINPDVSAVVTTRYRSDLTPRNRFLVKGTSRVLEIVSMSDPDGSQKFLVFGCREAK